MTRLTPAFSGISIHAVCVCGGGGWDLNVQLCHTNEFILGVSVFIADAKTTEAPDSVVLSSDGK